MMLLRTIWTLSIVWDIYIYIHTHHRQNPLKSNDAPRYVIFSSRNNNLLYIQATMISASKLTA